jgi:hypothetical protein
MSRVHGMAATAALAAALGLACSSSSSPGTCTLGTGGTFVLQMSLGKGSPTNCRAGDPTGTVSNVAVHVSTTSVQVQGAALPMYANDCAIGSPSCTGIQFTCDNAPDAGDASDAGDAGACATCGAYVWTLNVDNSRNVTGTADWKNGLCEWTLTGTFAP